MYTRPAALLLASGLVLSAMIPALVPAQARAEVAEFGAEGARFSIDVASGWKIRKANGGAQFVSPDQGSLLVVMLVPLDAGVDPGAMAKNYVESRPGAVMEQKDGAWVVKDGPRGDAKTIMICEAVDGKLLLKSFSGADQAGMEAMAGTVRTR